LFCPHCGKQIADDSVFCPLCGSPVKTTREQQAGNATAIPPTVPAQAPTVERNTFDRVVTEYGDVVTEEDLSAFLKANVRLLDTFYSLPLLSFTALIFVLGGVYNSNTFWQVYPALGYFFDFIAVVLFIASFYITYVRGRAKSLPDFFRLRYRQTLFAQYMEAKAQLHSAPGSRTAAEVAGPPAGGNNEFAQYVTRYPGAVSAADLAMLLRARLDWVVDTVKWIFLGLWVLVVFYLMVWFWFGTGPLEYASGILATLLFLVLIGNALTRFDGRFADNLRRLRSPSQVQELLLEDYLRAKRLTRT
jgi:hypothetical protein